MKLSNLIVLLAMCFALTLAGCSGKEPETGEKETSAKGTSEKETPIKETAQKETLTEKTAPKEALPEDSTHKEAPADESALKETPAEDSSRKEIPIEKSSPKATAEGFVAAMENRDAEAIWKLMSSNAIAQMDKDLAELKSGDDEGAKMGLAMLGINPAELETMDSKRFFIKTVNFVFSMLEAMEKETGEKAAMDFEIGEVKIGGDRAMVSVTNKAQNKMQEMPLVKEDGVWKFDANPMGTK